MNIMINDNLYLSLIIFIVASLVLTCLSAQIFKVLLKCWIGNKFSIGMLFADGDFPSAHTALVVAAFTLIVFLNLQTLTETDLQVINAYDAAKDILIMGTLTGIIIRDAMGQRHRQDNTNKNLKNLKDFIESTKTRDGINEHISNTFSSIDSEAFKRVGHLKHEVVGGIVNGLVFIFYPIIFCFGKQEWLQILIPVTIIYILGMFLFLKIRPSTSKRYKKSKKNN